MALSEQQPTSDAPRTMVGILFEAQGNDAEAEKWYREALKVNFRSATAANNLAWMYAQRGENLDKALELAQMAHAELPTQPDVTDTLGYVYLKTKMSGLAVTMFQNCVEITKDNPLYHYHLGLAYALNGDDAKARISLQKTLALSPDSAYAGDAKRALARLLY
jgi:Flp pilus assembly protein TadD